MLRTLLFALSRSRNAQRIAMYAPGIRGFSRRFVAGDTRDDALAAVRRLNADEFTATVSFLGEDVTSRAEADAAVVEFAAFASAVERDGLSSHLSIKLTELGLAFDRDFAREMLGRLLGVAGTFVRIDMEDSRYTEPTLEMFDAARASHSNVGIVIQSALRRSEADIVRLAQTGAPVRLVKGAYREPEDIAYQAKREVDASFVRLTERYLANMGEGAWLAIATHDERMIDAALRAIRAHAAGVDRYEFQMLYGVRTGLQRRLLADGHRVRIYVPYGSHWYPYLMRRLAERPANLWFFLRSAVRR